MSEKITNQSMKKAPNDNKRNCFDKNQRNIILKNFQKILKKINLQKDEWKNTNNCAKTSLRHWPSN